MSHGFWASYSLVFLLFLIVEFASNLPSHQSQQATTSPFLPLPSLPLCVVDFISHTSNWIMGMPEDEAEIDRLPLDLLSYILSFLTSFRCLGRASLVCRKWRKGVDRSYARNERLSFTGWSINDDSTARLVGLAYNLKDLDISRSCWGCQITDDGLCKISFAKCVSNLTSISLWGMTGITDKGVIVLVSKAISLQHLNIGGTFITDESLQAIADNCPQLKSIVLWSCRHVSGSGLVTLVNICRRLESINAWGMRVSGDCFASLLTINPGLQIKSGEMHLNVGPVPFWP